jgi:hypothetical protein
VRIHIALNHPHIIQLLAAFEDPEHVYLVQVGAGCHQYIAYICTQQVHDMFSKQRCAASLTGQPMQGSKVYA